MKLIGYQAVSSMGARCGASGHGPASGTLAIDLYQLAGWYNGKAITTSHPWLRYSNGLYDTIDRSLSGRHE